MKPSVLLCCSLVVLNLCGSVSVRAGEIHDAAKAGDLAKVKALVAANPAVVNLSEYGGPTPLHLAVAGGRTQVAEFLLTSKADPNAKLDDSHNAMMEGGFTPMHVAAAKGDVAMGRLLLKHKADVNLAAELIGPPLFVAVGQNQRAFVEFLLENKADPKAIQPAAGASLLHVAARLPKPDILRLLLARKLDVNKQMSDGRTPLLIAAEADNLAAAELLIAHGADVNVTDREGRSLLNIVRGNRESVALAKLLEKSGAKDTVSPHTKLADAVSAGRTNEVAALLKANPASVNMVVSELYAESLLHVAVQRGNAGMVRLLLDHKASVNAPDKRGWQPIHYATRMAGREQTNIVALLLEAKADINARGEQGNTPLHGALTLPQVAWVEFLIKNGANVNARNDAGQTPLALAAEIGEEDIEKVLRAHGGAGPPPAAFPAAIQGAVFEGKLAEVEAYLKLNPQAARGSNRGGVTLLEQAVSANQVAMARLLLKHGADVHVTNRYGAGLAQSLSSDAMAKLLVSQGLDLNRRNKNGWTALHEAALSGSTNTVVLLLANGADAGVGELQRGSTRPGRRPLELAEFVLAENEKVKRSGLRGQDHAGVVALLKPVTPERGAEPAAKTNASAKSPPQKPDQATAMAEARAKAQAAARAEAERLAKGEAEARAKAMELAKANTAKQATTSASAPKPAPQENVTFPVQLVRAAVRDDAATIQELLKAHPEILNKNENGPGSTALHYAAYNGRLAAAKVLLDAKPDVNMQNKAGYTALYEAARQGHKAIVALLLENKADPNIRDKKGKSPLQAASEAKRQEVVDLLRASGAKD